MRANQQIVQLVSQVLKFSLSYIFLAMAMPRTGENFSAEDCILLFLDDYSQLTMEYLQDEGGTLDEHKQRFEHRSPGLRLSRRILVREHSPLFVPLVVCHWPTCTSNYHDNPTGNDDRLVDEGKRVGNAVD